ncbi:O-antigen ligase family protein [Peribacillus kribbensis]|uniref:O-antigen ligase family protein n=1 Tax=Peribacillus kribbensis TaxID=356658 RepID=UPI00040E89FE|nr:O-antigen ligase family protein [Peribacillus kribbensis]
MQIKKSTLITFIFLIIIFLNERMFYFNDINNSLHVTLLLIITFVAFLLNSKQFLTRKFMFKEVITLYIIINIISLITTNLQFGQPLLLAISRYKYVFVVLLYIPITLMIGKIGTESIKKLIVKITSCLSLIYIIQALLYPKVIFLKVSYADRFNFTRFFDGAFFITLGLFLTISFIFKNKGLINNIKYYFAFLLQIIYIIFVAQTRNAIIPILLIIIILLLLKLKLNNVASFFKVGIVLIAGIIFLAPYVLNIFDSVLYDINRTEGTAAIRSQAKQFIEEKIKEKPIFGYGLYNNNFFEGQYITGSINKYFAQDVGIIGFVFQYGYIGLLLYVWMLIRIIFYSYKLFIINQGISVFYLSFCLYLCLTSAFTITLNVDNTLIYLVIFMALLENEYINLYKFPLCNIDNKVAFQIDSNNERLI